MKQNKCNIKSGFTVIPVALLSCALTACGSAALNGAQTYETTCLQVSEDVTEESFAGQVSGQEKQTDFTVYEPFGL